MQPVFQLLPENNLEVSRWEAMICRSQTHSITPGNRVKSRRFREELHNQQALFK
jgi:hypothetical protein